jgi:epoxide hydrolase-like protein
MATIESATEIHAFHVEVPEEELADLRRRIAATRWPETETVADESQGVELATMQELARYSAAALQRGDPRGVQLTALTRRSS